MMSQLIIYITAHDKSVNHIKYILITAYDESIRLITAYEETANHINNKRINSFLISFD